LLKQLKIGGKLVIPVGHPDDQFINVITRQDENNFSQVKTMCVRYVDLTSKEQQCPDMYQQ
jgi:protein-L-isoaspartate O-methyltransferase